MSMFMIIHNHGISIPLAKVIKKYETAKEMHKNMISDSFTDKKQKGTSCEMPP